MGTRLEWLGDRLRRLPWWRLAFACVFPLGLAIFWFVMMLRTDQEAWAIFYGLLVVVAAGVVLSAIVLKARARRLSN